MFLGKLLVSIQSIQIEHHLQTLCALLDESNNPNYKQVNLPLSIEWQVNGATSRCVVYPPVTVEANIDGVDVSFGSMFSFPLKTLLQSANRNTLMSLRNSWYHSQHPTLQHWPCRCINNGVPAYTRWAMQASTMLRP